MLGGGEVWQQLYELVVGVHDRNLAAATSHHGLTGGEVRALMRLRPGEGVPMRALGEVWRSDSSTVTWMVDRLERRGLVERRIVPTDRRVRAVALTAEGEATQTAVRALLYASPPGWAELHRDELACLHTVLGKIDASG
jgi:DNA-binding MarR family transcriptional regulator